MCLLLCVYIPKVCLLVQQVHPLHHLWYETPFVHVHAHILFRNTTKTITWLRSPPGRHVLLHDLPAACHCKSTLMLCRLAPPTAFNA
jgi:hypothetical protein